MTITKDMVIADVLAVDPHLAQILMDKGMRCVGCPSARNETLEGACPKHGANADEVVKEMNEYLAK